MHNCMLPKPPAKSLKCPGYLWLLWTSFALFLRLYSPFPWIWLPLPGCHIKHFKGCLILIKWKSSQFSGLLETLIWWGHLHSQNFTVYGFLMNDEIAISTNLEFFLISTDPHQNIAGHGTETTLSRGLQITLPLCHHIELFKGTCPDSTSTRKVPSSIPRNKCRGPASIGFAHPRVGVWGLEILGRRKRKMKGKEQRCRTEHGGQSSEY